jgi:tetratricopeptide (TPR) repeat protein
VQSVFIAKTALSLVGLLCCAAVAAAQDKPSAQDNSTDDFIKFYQWRVARDPDDYFNYDKLALGYIRKGRETGDITYYDLAEKSLQKSLELESTHREAISATVHLASVYFAEHRFKDALTFAQKALTFNTGDLSPYATIGDALIEMGEYDQASDAYSKLKEPEGGVVAHKALLYLDETRASNLAFFRGDPAGSIEHMRNAAGIAADTQMPRESIAWTQFTLGEEYFQAGDLANAQMANENALAAYPGYHRALAGLAKVRAAQERFPDAITLYQKALAVIPLPAYAAALGDVYTKVNRPADAKKQYDLVEFIAGLSALSKTIYNRELAAFYADHDLKLKESLELARKELEIRHDIYTWDCLAWTLYKNGKAQEASKAISKAVALGTKDPLLFFHAGMIYLRLGDRARAQDYLNRALTINAHFHVLYADVAQRSLRDCYVQ